MNKKPLIITLIVLIAISLLIFVGSVMFKKSDPSDPNSSSIISHIISTVKTPQTQGLKIEILKEGTGSEAKKDDRVIVRYVGTFENGTQFDSTVSNNQPFTFVLGQHKVIEGWELGVLGMKMGEKRRLTIPSSLAYGQAGRPPVIPPNTPLVFEIELLGILVK